MSDTRMDAAYIDEQLSMIYPEVIQEAYPERTYGAFPLAPGLNPGMASVVYMHAKAVGAAAFVDPDSRDVPLLQYDVTPVTALMHVARLGLEYSAEDVRRGQYTGQPLDRDKLVNVLQGHESKIDEMAWRGDASRSIYGLVNHPNILRLVTSTTFDSSSTPANILAVLNLMTAKLIGLTNGIERADSLALPPEEHKYISQTPYSSTGAGDTRTILEVFLAGNREITAVYPVHWLSTAGNGSTAVAVAFNRNRSKLEHLLAMSPTRLPSAWDGAVYRSVVESKTGGIQIKKPYSVLVVEGI